MPEREFIEYIRELTARNEAACPWLEVGVGDDAAVVRTPGAGRLLVTTDMVVEGVHFVTGTGMELVGHKAVARGLSDIAAMAGRPLFTVAAVHLAPGSTDADARALVRAISEAAERYGAPLIGGDVCRGGGALNVTLTAVGTPGPGGVVLRSGARTGDAVCVTGRLGASIRGRHLTFAPRIREALALGEGFDVHALIDVSDGLSTDVLHLAEASGVGVRLQEAAIPVSEDAETQARQTGRRPIEHALDDGEDYELLFCLPRKQARALVERGLEGLEVTVVGEVVKGSESCLILPDGSREPLRAGGWEYEV